MENQLQLFLRKLNDLYYSLESGTQSFLKDNQTKKLKRSNF